MTLFEQLKQLHPDLVHITFDGMDLEFLVVRADGTTEPFSIDEFAQGSETWKIMDKLEEIIANAEGDHAIHTERAGVGGDNGAEEGISRGETD